MRIMITINLSQKQKLSYQKEKISQPDIKLINYNTSQWHIIIWYVLTFVIKESNNLKYLLNVLQNIFSNGHFIKY